jgi:beta-barrel assembly-enhancing protease
VDAISLVSVEQEIEIGKQADAQVRQQTRELRDHETASYVRSIGRRLAAHARGAKYPYTFSVADDREINAFALPGGPIWLHRGVLHAATSEAQLASVIAHEIAHVSERHAARQLTNATLANWGLGLLGAVLGNDGGAAAARLAAGYLASGVFLKFGRDDEREADRVGLQMMMRAGWEGRGMVELFEILRREQARDPGRVEAFFSTHPPPQDRISRLRRAVATSRDGRRDSAEFRRIKARVAKIAARKTTS